MESIQKATTENTVIMSLFLRGSILRDGIFFRVVNAKGELAGAFAFGGADVQAELLREDGVEVVEGKVDLTKYQMDDQMEE